MLSAIQGNNPTLIQIVGTWSIFGAAAALVLIAFPLDWKTIALALIARDWAGGVVANAAESTRAWWRHRRKARTAFYLIHLVEAPLVWWFAGGGLVAFAFALVLAAKLIVFAMGKEGPKQSVSAVTARI